MKTAEDAGDAEDMEEDRQETTAEITWFSPFAFPRILGVLRVLCGFHSSFHFEGSTNTAVP
jgi:hypothetical protein